MIKKPAYPSKPVAGANCWCATVVCIMYNVSLVYNTKENQPSFLILQVLFITSD